MTSKLWLFPALLSLLTYSLWGVFNGLASRQIDANTGLFCSSLGYLCVGFVALALVGFKPSIAAHALMTRGGIYALFVGIATGLGGLFLLISLHQGGNTNVVITLTSIYPLATVLFNATFLHDSLTHQQLLGVALSVVGVTLLLIK